MFLYNLTLQPPTTINVAVVGHFSGAKQQEIAVSRVTRLELLKADPNSGKLQTLLTHDTFGIIRSLTPFRLTGSSKGAIVNFKKWKLLAEPILIIRVYSFSRTDISQQTIL